MTHEEAPRKIKKVLVIKLGALGDFIQALGAMAAIRRHHRNAEITLLTTGPYKGMAEDSGYFDNVWLDTKPKFYEPGSWLRLRKTLNDAGFDRVYDLQNNDRTAFYFRLFKGGRKPEWSGSVRGASHRNNSPERTRGHALDGHRQTLALAGIEDIEPDDLSWMRADISRFNLPESFAIIVPGSTPSHPEKRWPAESFAELCTMISEAGISPVITGTASEKRTAAAIAAKCGGAINISGQTSIYDIAAMARSAKLAVGNDTGPMHIAAASGCPSIVLFSRHTDPVKHAPRGDNVVILRGSDIRDIKPADVFAEVRKMPLTSMKK